MTGEIFRLTSGTTFLERPVMLKKKEHEKVHVPLIQRLEALTQIDLDECLCKILRLWQFYPNEALLVNGIRFNV